MTSRAKILQAIQDNPMITQSELVKLAGVSDQRVSVLLRELVESGAVVREEAVGIRYRATA